MKRARSGDGSVFLDTTKQAWVGVIDLGRDENGRRRRRKVFAATRPEAKQKLRQLRAEFEAGTLAAPNSMTVGDLLDRWIDTVAPAKVAPTALATYRGDRPPPLAWSGPPSAAILDARARRRVSRRKVLCGSVEVVVDSLPSGARPSAPVGRTPWLRRSQRGGPFGSPCRREAREGRTGSLPGRDAPVPSVGQETPSGRCAVCDGNARPPSRRSLWIAMVRHRPRGRRVACSSVAEALRRSAGHR